MTKAQLYVPGGKKPGDVEALALSEDPVHLRSGVSEGGLQLHIGHQFKVVQNEAGVWHVSTVAYMYRLDDGGGCELSPGTGIRRLA